MKAAWSGSTWDRDELGRRVDAARAQLTHLGKPARTIEPGEYRAYLAPAAMDELLSMLNWSGVSEKAQRTKQSCIQKLADGEASFSRLVRIAEDTAGGLAPAFDEAGFTKPSHVDLVCDGRHGGTMVSPRTAAEYGIAANGADEDESMLAMAVAPGTLSEEQSLAALDTGLYIGNLHYLNFSDRAHGRVTGMTRFATFWVEGGQVVAPVNVMRWDDTLYRMLGDNLEALTDRLALDTRQPHLWAPFRADQPGAGRVAAEDGVHALGSAGTRAIRTARVAPRRPLSAPRPSWRRPRLRPAAAPSVPRPTTSVPAPARGPCRLRRPALRAPVRRAPA